MAALKSMSRWLRDGDPGTREYALQGWFGTASWATATIVFATNDAGYFAVAACAALAGLSMGRVMWGGLR